MTFAELRKTDGWQAFEAILKIFGAGGVCAGILEFAHVEHRLSVIWGASAAVLALMSIFRSKFPKVSIAYYFAAACVVVPTVISFHSSNIPASAKYKACIDYAVDKHRPYAIESATMWVRLKEGEAKLVADVNVQYVLRMLQGVSDRDWVFPEHFAGSKYKSTKRWHGPQKEIDNGGRARYEVVFQANAGDTKTLFTGARYEIDWPFQPRTGFNDQVPLGANQDYFSYPNDEDAICELTMIIESDSPRLSTESAESVQWKDKMASRRPVEWHSSENNRRVIYSTWTDLWMNQEAGIVYKWE